MEDKWLELMDTSSVENEDIEELKVLVDRSIPSSIRGKVWIWLSGLRSNDEYYYRLLKEKNWDEGVIKMINLCNSRILTVQTYGENVEELKESVTNILLAFCSYFPNIGYFSGLNTVALLYRRVAREEVCIITTSLDLTIIIHLGCLLVVN